MSPYDLAGITRLVNDMIKYVHGNLLEADAEALINTVNTVGIMGKGIALQFRQAFPENYKVYKKACDQGTVKIGTVFFVTTGQLENPRYIINFPTKQHWKENTKIEYIQAGLIDLVRVITENNIRSVAIPPLGCGNGGLQWEMVRPIIESELAALDNVQILLYEPKGSPDADKMRISTNKPNMTLARAVIISLMSRYAIPGYKLSLLEVQKLAYLVQESGQPLKLDFQKYKYGPYAETLQHALQSMEGHFIRGYGDRSKDASMYLLPDAVSEAENYLQQFPEANTHIDKVAELIDGLETPYGMELLATILYVTKENPKAKYDVEESINGVHSWTERKRIIFQRKHIEALWARLHDQGWIA